MGQPKDKKYYELFFARLFDLLLLLRFAFFCCLSDELI